MKALNKPLIYIVEDDANYQGYIQNELTHINNNNVEIYSHGSECVNNLFKMPDIILLDYNLEGEMNGIQVLKNIKAFNPDIQVILLSAQENIEIAVDALKYGAYDYIIKNEVALQKINGMVQKIINLNLFANKKKGANKLKNILFFGFVSITLFLLITLKIALTYEIY